jgi:MFS family permease
VRLALFFGTLYFIQGVSEPVEGLIAQPVRSILKGWGEGNARITMFSALLAIPWSLKPLYGLISDFIPIAGSRRRSYLILAALASIVGLLTIYFAPQSAGTPMALLGWLLVPTVAVAFSDVVTDALLVEKAQPRNLTGTLQAVQWGCMYGATMLTGTLGGYLSEHHSESLGFLICAALATITLLLALFGAKETGPRVRAPAGEFLAALGRAVRTPGLVSVAGFLFLWNFNPFSNAVLYLHMTRALGFSEQFYGHTVSLLAGASMVACVAYSLYCRRIGMMRLVKASIVLGVVSTLAYGFLNGKTSAVAVTIGVGLVYMTATLIQLDLAARICSVEVAGTIFATLMALENLANASSTALGGWLYEWACERWGSHISFLIVVAVGASTTAACWLLLPLLSNQDRAREGATLH